MNPNSPTAGVVRLRERLKQSIREEILNAAERVFSREGVVQSRMDAIAKEAGVAVGTLYNHFTDREALIDSLNDARRDDLIARLDAVLDPALPTREQLVAMVKAVLEHTEDHGNFMRILMESDVGFTRSKRTIEVLHDRIHALVKRGLKRKELVAHDEELVPALLLGMIRGLMIRRMKVNSPQDPAHAATELARVFFEGVDP